MTTYTTALTEILKCWLLDWSPSMSPGATLSDYTRRRQLQLQANPFNPPPAALEALTTLTAWLHVDVDDDEAMEGDNPEEVAAREEAERRSSQLLSALSNLQRSEGVADRRTQMKTGLCACMELRCKTRDTLFEREWNYLGEALIDAPPRHRATRV